MTAKWKYIIIEINHENLEGEKHAFGAIIFPQKSWLLSNKVDMQIHTLALLLEDNPFLGGIITVCDLAVAMAAACVSNNKVLHVAR